LMPNISSPQRRDLHRILDRMNKDNRKAGGTYNLKDVIKVIEGEEKLKTKEGLVGLLYDLNKHGIFSDVDYPSTKSLVKPGQMSIIDMSNILGSRKKQIITNHIASQLFNMRRNKEIPPFLLILEEAHQFVPEGREENALARKIIETIAREGRKFHASLCLISQRPKRLSTTVLSQCNTHIILRVTNPYDLDHIKNSSEGITSETADSISSLPVGEGLIVGEAVNYPIFVKIREKYSQDSSKSMDLETAAKEFETAKEKKSKDAESFM